MQDLLLLLRVQVVDGREAKPGSQCHLDGFAHVTYVEDLDDRATMVRLLVRRRLDPCLLKDGFVNLHDFRLRPTLAQ